MTAANGSPAHLISQMELADHQRLEDQYRTLKRELQSSRERLARHIDGGGEVEPGPLGVRMQPTTRQAVTKSFLIGILGENGYQDLRAEAPVTSSRRIIVEADPAYQGTRAWGNRCPSPPPREIRGSSPRPSFLDGRG